MKLQKFDYEMKDNAKKNKSSKIVIVLIALLGIFVIYKTYADFILKSESKNLFKAIVGDFSTIKIIGEDCTVNDIGCEVAIGDEHFYVIGDDEDDPTKVKLLAKYNLKVGGIYEVTDSGSTKTKKGEYAPGDEGYNFQSSDTILKAFSIDDDITIYTNGTVAFSTSDYWMSGDTPIYESTYVYDDNAEIKTHVDNYKSLMESEYNITIKEARLISIEEIEALNTTKVEEGTTEWETAWENAYNFSNEGELLVDLNNIYDYPWIYNTTYWTGSRDETGSGQKSIYNVISFEGGYDTNDNEKENITGVRPVIVVDKSIFGPYMLSGDTSTIGSEAVIGTEHFYVISNDTGSGTVTMLSKYNLYVGRIYNGTSLVKTISPSDDNYNMQSSDTLGYVSGVENYVGTLSFDSNYTTAGYSYWTDESNNLLSQYKTDGQPDYPAWVYDGNTIIKNYVDTYKNNIEQENKITINSARLLKLSELEDLGCDSTSKTCNTSTVTNNNRQWIYQTAYWTGTAGGQAGTWGVDWIKELNNFATQLVNSFGVRPVITVPTSIFE